MLERKAKLLQNRTRQERKPEKEMQRNAKANEERKV